MTETQTAPERASLFRRLAALFYDSLLLIAILFLAAIPPSLMFGTEQKQLQAAFYTGHPLLEAGFYLYILGVAFLFFGWFWTHGGQTLGLKSWRLRVITIEGYPASWKHAAVRYLVALAVLAVFSIAVVVIWRHMPLGAIRGLAVAIFTGGFGWLYFDHEQLTLHDRLSGTQIVAVGKDNPT